MFVLALTEGWELALVADRYDWQMVTALKRSFLPRLHSPLSMSLYSVVQTLTTFNWFRFTLLCCTCHHFCITLLLDFITAVTYVHRSTVTRMCLVYICCVSVLLTCVLHYITIFDLIVFWFIVLIFITVLLFLLWICMCVRLLWWINMFLTMFLYSYWGRTTKRIYASAFR